MIPALTVASQQSFNRDLDRCDLVETHRIGGPATATVSSGSGDKSLLVALNGWQFHRAPECHRSRRFSAVEDGQSVRDWLFAHRKDALAMTALRTVVLAEGPSIHLNRMRDEDVIQQVAGLLRIGRWHICVPVIRVYPVTTSGAPEVMSVPRRGPAPSPPAPAYDSPDPDSLAGNADQGAIAAVLLQAAINGNSVCEECTRRAGR